MFRHDKFVWALLVVLFSGSCVTTVDEEASETTRPPNILLILADDMGYGDPGCYNPESKIPTPNIDRLAAEGMRFTDAHSPSAVCTPTRYALLTGRYSWRSRLKEGVLNGYSPNLIEKDRLTMASMLKQAGYTTAGVGKWHLGLGEVEPVDYSQPLLPGPRSHGFDYYFGIPASLDMPPYVFFENDSVEALPTDETEDTMPCCVGAFWRGGPMAPGFVHSDVLPRTAERAVNFIEERGKTRSGRPFFLYVPFSAPHTPWLPTEQYRGVSKAGEYGDFTAQVDASVGSLLTCLDRNELSANTLVVFTSDNGAYWTSKEIDVYGHRSNLSFRGMKADIWEGGHRVPFVVRWPGKIMPGSTSHAVIALNDLMATFASVADLPLPQNAAEDSQDLLPILMQQEGSSRQATIHHSASGMFAIRQGPWKLIEGLGSGGFTEPVSVEPRSGGPTGQLYNLEEDPAETTNVFEEYPEVVKRLTDSLERLRQQGYSRSLQADGPE